MLDSIEFGNLSPQATKLLLELARQYRGRNNGDFSAPWTRLSTRGWRSPSTLARAKAEIVMSGFAVLTRQGGRHRCSLYAMTWWAVDDCNGKLDERATHAPLHLWKKHKTLVQMRSDVDQECINQANGSREAVVTDPNAYQSASQDSIP